MPQQAFAQRRVSCQFVEGFFYTTGLPENRYRPQHASDDEEKEHHRIGNNYALGSRQHRKNRKCHPGYEHCPKTIDPQNCFDNDR